MTLSTTIYRKLIAGTALTLAVAVIAVPVAGAGTLDPTKLPCWPTCPSFDTEPGQAIAGITDARHAGLFLRHERDRSVEPGLISRPTPADAIAANAPASISAPVVDGPADRFDYRDAFVGAIIAFAAVLLLLGAARLVQGHGRLAHR